MDSFGNYPRERPFDPFSVMLFKALQVVAFLFFIALLVINPEAKQGKIDTKADFIITMTWPDSHPDDIDLYAEDPLGNIVWYHVREAGFMVLDRDDRGGFNNSIVVNGKRMSSPIRQETVSIRGIVAGEYTVNVNHYLATTNAPVPVVGEGREGQPDRRGRPLRHADARSCRAGENRGAVPRRRQRPGHRREPPGQIADPTDAQRPPFGEVGKDRHGQHDSERCSPFRSPTS